MTREEGREKRIVRCPACNRYYRLPGGPPAPGMRLRCSQCGKVFSAAPEPAAAPAPRPAAASGDHRVLVASDGAEFQSLIGEVLQGQGYALRQAQNGEAAWELIGPWRPHVVLLDVALPGMPSFELCDRVRADEGLRGTGLILIASVFQQTRYKRAPTSLYGADDYIEKHHIRDWLPGKVARLLPGAAAPVQPATAPAAPVAPAAATPAAPGAPAAPAAPAAPHRVIDAREQETLIREELYGSAGRQRPGLERLRESLRRYARIIVSDIALYNQELVERGIREGTFSELLKKELEEGRKLYLTRVPPSSGGADHYQEAVQDFIARRSAPQGGRRGPRGEA